MAANGEVREEEGEEAQVVLQPPGSVVEFEIDDPNHGKITYQLRVPSVWERSRYQAGVRQKGGRQPGELELLALLGKGVRELMPAGHAREEILAALDEHRASVLSFMQELQEAGFDNVDDPVQAMVQMAERLELPPRLREVADLVMQHFDPFAKALADREVYFQIAGAVGAQMFLVGWQGLEAEFRRDPVRGVPDEVLAEIPYGHFAALAGKVQSLLEPPTARLKNLRSGSGGRSGRTTSPASKTSTKRPKRTKQHGRSPSTR